MIVERQHQHLDICIERNAYYVFVCYVYALNSYILHISKQKTGIHILIHIAIKHIKIIKKIIQ